MPILSVVNERSSVSQIKICSGEFVARLAPLCKRMAFGDLNGDGLLHLVVPHSKNFAVALLGNSGERIWQGPDAGILSATSQAPVKKLAAAILMDGRIMVLGNDPSASGLRALELRKGLPGAVR